MVAIHTLENMHHAVVGCSNQIFAATMLLIADCGNRTIQNITQITLSGFTDTVRTVCTVITADPACPIEQFFPFVFVTTLNTEIGIVDFIIRDGVYKVSIRTCVNQRFTITKGRLGNCTFPPTITII